MSFPKTCYDANEINHLLRESIDSIESIDKSVGLSHFKRHQITFKPFKPNVHIMQ